MKKLLTFSLRRIDRLSVRARSGRLVRWRLRGAALCRRRLVRRRKGPEPDGAVIAGGRRAPIDFTST